MSWATVPVSWSMSKSFALAYCEIHFTCMLILAVLQKDMLWYTKIHIASQLLPPSLATNQLPASWVSFVPRVVRKSRLNSGSYLFSQKYTKLISLCWLVKILKLPVLWGIWKCDQDIQLIYELIFLDLFCKLKFPPILGWYDRLQYCLMEGLTLHGEWRGNWVEWGFGRGRDPERRGGRWKWEKYVKS